MSSCSDEIEEWSLSERCPSVSHINSSAIAKSHMHTLDLSRRNLHNLPPLLPRVQRLLACDNMLSQVPSIIALHSLRHLDLSGNYIELVPRALAQLAQLDTLKLNSNLITRVTAITQVRVYQLLGNPIVYLETDCGDAKMEQFGIDWLSYLDAEGSAIWQETKLALWKTSLKDYASSNAITMTSSNMYHTQNTQTLRTHNPHEMDIEAFLGEFLTPIQRTKMLKKNIYNAILKKHHQFFEYLVKIIGPSETPEEYEHDGKLLFELALAEHCEPALNFFKKQRFSKNSNTQFLSIVARHSNLQFFNLMIKKGHSIHQSYRNANSPLHELISNFDAIRSPPVLVILLKFLCNSNCKNQKRLNCLVYSATKKSHCFAEFLRYLQHHPEIIQYFGFDELCGVKLQENVLHLAARKAEVLVITRLLSLEVVDPFVRNSLNRRARSITPHYLIRKLLAKTERKYLARSFKLASEYEDLSQEVLVSLPSMRTSSPSTSLTVKSLQMELMKSHQLSEKIRRLLEVLFTDRHRIYENKILQQIMELRFGEHEEVLRQIVLGFLQRQQTNRQFIGVELQYCHRLKLGRTTFSQSCTSNSPSQVSGVLELFEEMQTIALMQTCIRTTQDSQHQRSYKTILPFSFPLCAEVDVASESVITVEPRVMKTFRDGRELKDPRHGQPQQTTQGNDMVNSTMRKPYIKQIPIRPQNRRLSLTFIR